MHKCQNNSYRRLLQTSNGHINPKRKYLPSNLGAMLGLQTSKNNFKGVFHWLNADLGLPVAAAETRKLKEVFQVSLLLEFYWKVETVTRQTSPKQGSLHRIRTSDERHQFKLHPLNRQSHFLWASQEYFRLSFCLVEVRTKEVLAYQSRGLAWGCPEVHFKQWHESLPKSFRSFSCSLIPTSWTSWLQWLHD
jgi:hypothetical protein